MQDVDRPGRAGGLSSVMDDDEDQPTIRQRAKGAWDRAVLYAWYALLVVLVLGAMFASTPGGGWE